ncbi:MAG: acylphosphatase [Planctomycetota bacterium]|nr:acylphosphatase [Planctomycetota bacterium]
MLPKTPGPSPAAPGIRRLHVLFLGTVQGVGFRYTALSIARCHAVTGWVRNVPDGRVELVAEGPSGELEAFLADVGEEMASYISSVERTWEPATGEWNRFTITGAF